MRNYKRLEAISRDYIKNEQAITRITHATLAYALSKQGDYESTVSEYGLLLRHFPDRFLYYFYLAKVLYKNKQYADVLDTCGTFFALNLENRNQNIVDQVRRYMYWYAGYSAYQLRHFAPASEYLKEYIKYKKVKKGQRYYEIIGYGYLIKNQIEEAAYYFTKAIETDPESQYAQQILEQLKSDESGRDQ